MPVTNVFQCLSGLSIQRIDLEINVVGGSGQAAFYLTGTMKSICFKPPVNAAFDYTIIDDMEFGIYGESNLNCITTTMVDLICADTNLLSLSNATDGTYYIRIYAII